MDSYYTKGEREYLLRIARETLDMILLSGEKYEPQTLNQKLWEKGGVIVKLFVGKELRSEAKIDRKDEAIIVAIRDAVLLACNNDQFPRVDELELDKLKIEITLLAHDELSESVFKELAR
jgi:AMMECR1 domain-containing protein